MDKDTDMVGDKVEGKAEDMVGYIVEDNFDYCNNCYCGRLTKKGQ